MSGVLSATLPEWQAWLPVIGAAFLCGFLCTALAWRWLAAPAKAHAGAGSTTAVLASIGTAVPAYHADGAWFLRACSGMGYSKDTLGLVEKVVSRGGINGRYTILGDIAPETAIDRLAATPRTRAELWEEHAPKMAIAAARQALAQWPGGDARDVTHVVVHSCTGFSAPGLDFLLIQALGLPSHTRKLGVNYMGCFGFFTATYVAKQIIEADTTGRAVVLVACAETASIHFSKSEAPELIVGNTLFADGSAAAIITHAGFKGRGARTLSGPAPDGKTIDPATNTPAFRLSGLVDSSDGAAYEWALGAMSSEIVPNSAGHMTWKQSWEPGRYDMYLDKGIPDALARTLGGSAVSLLSRVGILNPWMRTAWAIHPGGKAILNGFTTALSTLAIPTTGIEVSREVLAGYGNMSSPTIAFVLQRVLTGVAGAGADNIFFAGFGPGLTVEIGRIYKHKGGSNRAVSDVAPEAIPQAVAAAAAPTISTDAAALPSAAGRAAASAPAGTSSGSSSADGTGSEVTSSSDPATPSRLSPTQQVSAGFGAGAAEEPGVPTDQHQQEQASGAATQAPQAAKAAAVAAQLPAGSPNTVRQRGAGAGRRRAD